ncbi:MAG TPA: hypothetical protein VK151_14710 [Fluviicola sp.]|nr:hypothetical protein [Fluviicola sp.]
MKYLFLLPLLFVAQLALAQQTCEMKFQMVTRDSVGLSDTIFFDVAQTTKKIVVEYREGIVYERFVVDSIAAKVLELTSESDQKLAYEYDMQNDEFYGSTLAFAIVNQDFLEPERYRLLSDKKVVQGWNCQKIEFLQDGVAYASGWLALGLSIGYKSNTGFFRAKEGSVIEYTVPDNGSGKSITMKLVKSSKTIANPAKVFSLEIPEGYTLGTMDDYYDYYYDYYDDEEED